MSRVSQLEFFIMSATPKTATSKKNLKELRALARSRGLRGYSKMKRHELEQLLARHGATKQADTQNTRQVVKKKGHTRSGNKTSMTPEKPVKTRTKKGRSMAAAAPPPPNTPVSPFPVPKWEWITDARRQPMDEEQVESAKYATVLPGSSLPPHDIADLGEDIDSLPPVTEPTLCLLPQKPGVLHGYWIVPPNSIASAPSLKLRLGRIVRDTLQIIDEIALPDIRGRWYFHVHDFADIGTAYLQLGYYEPDGRFITATRRGIARVPSLYASGRTDQLWWISEEQFRAMYRRAGGHVRGARLGWAASISSPGGAPGAPPTDRLAWPGNISSR